jgi:hypothetical protein
MPAQFVADADAVLCLLGSLPPSFGPQEQRGHSEGILIQQTKYEGNY